MLKKNETIWCDARLFVRLLHSLRFVQVTFYTRVLMQSVLFICLLCCLFGLCSPSFPFYRNNCPCIWIVFTWLFGEPSCGETTLLNSPSEQTNVSYYIRIYKRYIHLHASLYMIVCMALSMCTSVLMFIRLHLNRNRSRGRRCRCFSRSHGEKGTISTKLQTWM